jgi:exopolysaccharide biosynthesis polyprenyl glycosylphosphotransferase
MSNRLGRIAIRNITILADLLLINAGFIFAYVARYEFQWLLPASVVVPYSEYLGQQLLLTLILIVAFTQNKAWTRRRGEPWLDEASRIGYATATGIALMMAFTFFARPLAFSRLLLVWALIFIVLFVALGRLARRLLLEVLYRQGIGADLAIIVGSDEVGRSVIRTLLARPDLGFKAIGYLDEGSGGNSVGSGRIPHLGGLNMLPELLAREPAVDTVFVALPSHLHSEIAEVLRICQRHGVQVRVVPDLFQLSLNRVEFNNLAGIPMLNAREVRISPTGQVLKRVMDLVVVALVSIPAAFITVVTAAAVRLESPGPAFFWQERIGYRGRPFKMAKFRSMVVGAEEQREMLQPYNEATGPIFKIRQDPRTTRVGRFIRRLSLDELPQLYNVLIGEMSLVGPRPPLPDEVEQYQPWHLQRLEVRGGITGLWQVSGRSDLTFDEQCLLDIYYIENWSLAMDLRIILQTIPHVLFGRGAY